MLHMRRDTGLPQLLYEDRAALLQAVHTEGRLRVEHNLVVLQVREERRADLTTLHHVDGNGWLLSHLVQQLPDPRRGVGRCAGWVDGPHGNHLGAVQRRGSPAVRYRQVGPGAEEHADHQGGKTQVLLDCVVERGRAPDASRIHVGLCLHQEVHRVDVAASLEGDVQRRLAGRVGVVDICPGLQGEARLLHLVLTDGIHQLEVQRHDVGGRRRRGRAPGDPQTQSVMLAEQRRGRVLGRTEKPRLEGARPLHAQPRGIGSAERARGLWPVQLGDVAAGAGGRDTSAGERILRKHPGVLQGRCRRRRLQVGGRWRIPHSRNVRHRRGRGSSQTSRGARRLLGSHNLLKQLRQGHGEGELEGEDLLLGAGVEDDVHTLRLDVEHRGIEPRAHHLDHLCTVVPARFDLHQPKGSPLAQ
mmetsp:Transcript_92937/g.240054  ORF Transcript_92937/g.240054 Transcript_92937/m.240054 type:complete len:415 (+) Transcript_92937:1282-2526(+)